MRCHWCGSGARVKEVRRNGVPVVGPVRGIPLHLCYVCWGMMRAEGRRVDQTGAPTRLDNGGGIPLTPSLLRQMGQG